MYVYSGMASCCAVRGNVWRRSLCKAMDCGIRPGTWVTWVVQASHRPPSHWREPSAKPSRPSGPAELIPQAAKPPAAAEVREQCRGMLVPYMLGNIQTTLMHYIWLGPLCSGLLWGMQWLLGQDCRLASQVAGNPPAHMRA